MIPLYLRGILSGMKALRQHLKRKRLSQSEFARRMNVSQPTVWGWINGTKNPRADKLCEIAEQTGLTVDELLGREVA